MSISLHYAFTAFFAMLCEMAPWLLLGFLFAGLLREFVPASFFEKHLAKDNFKSVLWATLIGIPLPLCSCGVIPTAVSLRKGGASRGATTAFLIATPQVGVDSIIATYSLMGLPFAICRPLVALVTALSGGAVAARFGKDEIEVKRVAAAGPAVKKPLGHKVADMLRYAFIEMIQNIGKWLLIGLLLGAMITVFLPDNFFASLNLPSFVTMLIVLLVAIPMYTCSMGSIPIAAALIMKGLSPGTALVLLVAGPAASIASMMVIGKSLGRKQLWFYLGSVIAGSLAGGLVMDALPRSWFSLPVMQLMTCCGETGLPGIFEMVCAGILVCLFIIAFTMKWTGKKSAVEPAEGCTLYSVKGMSCSHCQKSVEKAAMTVEGVEKALADVDKAVLSVRGTANEAQLKKAIEDIGFEFGGKIK